MARVSFNGQVTLPKGIRESSHISSGDEVDFLNYEGQITIIQKRPDASRGVMARFKLDPAQAIAEGRLSSI
ncbi:MAG: AbrB/MazE/SpoVT family DNA-binding domain-containing protein [Noviherbaspirillum sp.]